MKRHDQFYAFISTSILMTHQGLNLSVLAQVQMGEGQPKCTEIDMRDGDNTYLSISARRVMI